MVFKKSVWQGCVQLGISLFITPLKLPSFHETICISPLNYLTVMIRYGQVPSVSWYGPEGFMMRSSLHSAPEVLQRIYLETRSLSRETLGWGTYLALQLTDVSLIPFFLFPSFQPLFLCILSAFISVIKISILAFRPDLRSYEAFVRFTITFSL